MNSCPREGCLLHQTEVGLLQNFNVRDIKVFQKNDVINILVATSEGGILRGAFPGRPPPPRQFRLRRNANAKENCLASPAADLLGVTTLHISNMDSDFFLAGYFSGIVALYSLSSASPLQTWEGFSAASLHIVRWVPKRTTAFLALDTSGILHAFDLFKDENRPLCSEAIRPFTAHGTERLTYMDVFPLQNEMAQRCPETQLFYVLAEEKKGLVCHALPSALGMATNDENYLHQRFGTGQTGQN